MDRSEWVEGLFREEYPKLVGFANKRLQNEDQAQELVQETFKLLWEKSEDLQDHPNIRGWLRSTLKNKLLIFWRTGQTDLERFVYCELDTVADPAGSSEELLTRLTEAEILAVARKKLSAEDYHHLLRITVDGASHAAVSQELGISISASQKRLERSRAVLKKEFPRRGRKMKKFQKICQLLVLNVIHR